jgi:predicted TIM-barrel fold metal-dependent hydrolase
MWIENMFRKSSTTETAEAFDAMIRGLDLPTHRNPQQRGGTVLPPGTVVVSADNHWSLTQDIFYERFPRHLRDKAPRLWKGDDGAFNWSIDGQLMIPPMVQKVFSNYEPVPGCTSIPERLRDLDIEGIDKEINFGNGIGMFYAYADLEVREWVFRIYNEHLAEMQAAAPGRFYGVGLINYWDMARVSQSIAELKALGLRTFLLPILPKGAGGVPLNYCLPEMQPLWQAAEAAGLPVCFHVGEFYTDGPGGLGTTMMETFGPFRRNLGQLIFGGIFDRHPDLQVVFVEAEINWVPGALQSASMIYECFRELIDPKIEHHPRHYWHNNCYATFTHDPVGLRMLDILGADRVMWSNDYPHLESTFGFGWSAIKAVLDAVSEDQARDILGGTALKLFKLK